MSSEDSNRLSGDIQRRNVLKSLGAAGTVGLGGKGVTGAASAHTGEFIPSPAQLDPLPVVRGSTGQVLVIGATDGATLKLEAPDGSVVESATADSYGSYAFQEVSPDEGYSVIEDDGGTTTVLADTIRVYTDDYTPPQSLYDQQNLQETADGEIGYIEMRDGTTMAYQAALPSGDPPYPTLIMYSGYAPSVNLLLPPSVVNLYGYAIVGVNMRATQCSGGKFDLGEKLQWLDGYDIVEAVAAQDWSDGVGLVGASFSGFSQFYAAATNPPSLDALAPAVPVGDFFRDVGWPGGMLNTTFAGSWAKDRDTETEPFTNDPGMGDVDERVNNDDMCYRNQLLRLQNEPTYDRMVNNEYAQDFWVDRSPWNFVDQIESPILLSVAWQDEQVGARSGRLLERFDDDTTVHFSAINGGHASFLALVPDIVNFFDFYVKEEVPDDFEGPYEEALAEFESEPYRIHWEQDQNATDRAVTEYSDWPPGETWELYFDASFPDDLEGVTSVTGGLSEELPATTGEWSEYDYTAPTVSDQQLDRDSNERLLWEHEPDGTALSFVSEKLPSDHMLLGSGLAELWMRTPQDDTDVQVDISEIRPDGKEMYVQSGWLRASRRVEDDTKALTGRPWHTHLPEDEQPVPSSEFTKMRVEFHPVGHVFHRGSRVKVTVSNPGGSRDRWAFDVVDQTGPVEVAHDEVHPSKVELPLVPDAHAPVRSRSPCGSVRHQPCRDASEFTFELPTLTDQGPPQDLDEDGLYENTSGSGTPSILDVQILYQHLDDQERVQDNAWAYNFSRTDPTEVTIFDVQALYYLVTADQ